jgi:hypothetical protein
VRKAAALIALIAAAAGCGGGGDSGREAVESYIEEANRAQVQFQPAVRSAQNAIRSFAAGRSGEKVAERLREAAATMRSARAALARVQPPPEARTLHEQQLELLDLQVRLSLELSLAAGYLPDAVEAIRPADDAGGALARALRTAKTGEKQAAALAGYAEEVDGVLETLAALGAPPVLKPWHRAQVSRLEASRNLAAGLAKGIRQEDRGAIDRALKAFSAQTPDRKVAQKAQAEAIAAFNERLEAQQELLSSIYREQAELAEKFGS